MPIINSIDRKTLRGRLALAALYTVLAIGALTMIYPFLIMISMSVSNEADSKTMKIWPAYLSSDEALYKKFLATKYNGFQKFLGTRHLNRHHLSNIARIEDLGDPKIRMMTVETGRGQEMMPVPVDLSHPPQMQRGQDWHRFISSLPSTHVTRSCEVWLIKRYQEWLRQRYGRDLAAINSAYGESVVSILQIQLPFHDPYMRNWKPGKDPKSLEWESFWKDQPLSYRLPVRMDGMYQEFLKQQVGAVTKFNQLAGTQFTSMSEIRLDRQAPSDPRLQKLWMEFIHKKIPHSYLSLSFSQNAFRKWLAAKYGNDISRLNKRHGTTWRSFMEIPLAGQQPDREGAAADWSEFITAAIQPGDIHLDTVETRWADWLRREYHDDLAVLNKSYGLSVKSFEDVPLPYAEGDRLFADQNRGSMRLKYLWENYDTVISHLIVHGRAFYNTAVLCLAMILAQLTVNPLCAYALSRFKLTYKFKVILFLIATMTFPAEVLMIPNFLTLKEFHLLNSYWALILPGLANGYFIFMMKGFFDSLPKELFEAAELDGAGEVRMFLQIAYPLSKPIFAVKALAAFTTAYGGFMWAFLVCQDPSMWTIMVQLYQFQIGQPQHLIMASLALASIPTLIVFLFCQGIIMRGIILPTMK